MNLQNDNEFDDNYILDAAITAIQLPALSVSSIPWSGLEKLFPMQDGVTAAELNVWNIQQALFC